MFQSFGSSQRYRWLSLGLLAIVGSFLALGRSASAETLLGEQLAEKLTAMQCPGALVGIFPDQISDQISDQDEPQRFALGVADVTTKRPMALDMHMRIGSVGKPLIGTVVLQLVGEGKLSLDDPISKYVENVPRGDQITIRMLGNNTSGLFNTIENKGFQQAIMERPERSWLPGEIFEFTFGQESYAPPGEKFRYSNTNAILLAQAIKKVTGEHYGMQVESRICRVLGLRQTAIPIEGQLPEPCPRAYRNGYPDKVIGYGNVFYDVTSYSASWTNAAGEWYSTLDDLGRMARPLAMGQLLKEAERQTCLDWIETGHQDIQYGFLIAKRDGGIGHSGDVPGFDAVCSYYPDLKATVVVLTNLSNNQDGTMPAEQLAAIVLNHLRAR
jgi:D-alanyl-D-alanine carboxypeptidase